MKWCIRKISKTFADVVTVGEKYGAGILACVNRKVAEKIVADHNIVEAIIHATDVEHFVVIPLTCPRALQEDVVHVLGQAIGEAGGFLNYLGKIQIV